MVRRLSYGLSLAALLSGLVAPSRAVEVGGAVSGEWTPDMNPVTVVEPSFVPAGEALFIRAGVQVYLRNGTRLEVNGTLSAQGSSASPVTFLPADPEPWDSVSVQVGGTAALSRCVVRGGGGGADTNGMLRVDGGELVLLACDVTGSAGNGVLVNSGRFSASSSRFHGNGGVLPKDAALHLVTGLVLLGEGMSRNSITNTTTYGIYNDGLDLVSARDTWWGSASGPQHSDNIDGLGCPVSDDVDWSSFASTTPFPFAGDLNRDGAVSMPDVVRCALIAGGLEAADAVTAQAADVAADGAVTLQDVARLLRAVQGLQRL